MRRLRPGAHPRSRGENACGNAGHRSGGGSSPLTREKPRDGQAHPLSDGLIPAHAGKTASPHRLPGCVWAHPRSRGENIGCLVENGAGEGSSPLTRGKPFGRPRPPHSAGLIPAHAGKTFTASCARIADKAHPRSRGENAPVPCAGVSGQGSSPLTRGKLIPRTFARSVCGLIPAHAGKTVESDSSAGTRWAHPRSRGENPMA